MSENRNFVCARLCDNDFGHVLRDALEDGLMNHDLTDDTDIALWKNFIIVYVVGQALLNNVTRTDKLPIDWDYAQQLTLYLDKQLSLAYETTNPSEDHDNGSAAICLNTGNAWTF